ncbi:MAG: CHAT domain-containing protein [Chloroflexi bacterium]|nr:CHAT domain-containing protein [Chloroflexota bacterium]
MPYSYLEAALAHTVCGLAGPPPLAKAAATRDALQAMAYLTDCLLISTHGEAVAGHADRFRLYLADGPLTAQHLLSVPGHHGVHLKPGVTVLCSACFSAIGQLKASDETVSPVTAFLSEGANSVTSTLWPVDDLATCFLMVFLLKAFARGTTLADALKLAQAQVRQLSADDAVARLLSWEKVLNEGHMVPAEVIGLIWSAVAEMALCSQPPNTVLAQDSYQRANMILTNERSPYLATIERRRESADLTKGSTHPRYGAPYPFANPYFWAGLVAHSLI